MRCMADTMLARLSSLNTHLSQISEKPSADNTMKAAATGAATATSCIPNTSARNSKDSCLSRCMTSILTTGKIERTGHALVKEPERGRETGKSDPVQDQSMTEAIRGVPHQANAASIAGPAENTSEVDRETGEIETKIIIAAGATIAAAETKVPMNAGTMTAIESIMTDLVGMMMIAMASHLLRLMILSWADRHPKREGP